MLLLTVPLAASAFFLGGAFHSTCGFASQRQNLHCNQACLLLELDHDPNKRCVCVRACVRACVRVCVCACACLFVTHSLTLSLTPSTHSLNTHSLTQGGVQSICRQVPQVCQCQSKPLPRFVFLHPLALCVSSAHPFVLPLIYSTNTHTHTHSHTHIHTHTHTQRCTLQGLPLLMPALRSCESATLGTSSLLAR